MKTYRIVWTNTDECSADVTSEELADALGLSVEEVEANMDTEAGQYGDLDLENGLAVIEERGDVFDGCTREIISVGRGQLRLNQHNNNDGLWCRLSGSTLIERPNVADEERRCPFGCTASQATRPE